MSSEARSVRGPAVRPESPRQNAWANRRKAPDDVESAAFVQSAAGNAAMSRAFANPSGRGHNRGPWAIAPPRDSGEDEARRVADCEGRPIGRIAARGDVSAGVRVSHASALGDVLNRSDGSPLPIGEGRYFEERFGRDLSAVRVHTDERANTAAGQIGAKAFTHRRHIYFGAGYWSPGTRSGRRLLAHELTHTLQQGDDGDELIQADFEGQFAGRTEVRVADQAVRPRGTIRTTNNAGEAVWAPFGIFTPQEIPDAYQDRIMESGKAYQFRHPELPLGQAAALENQRGENSREVTVRDMRNLSEGRGRNMNIQIMMAHVGNDFRFVGFDTSQVTGGIVHEGFVESQVGTGGVGRALFANRVLRSMQQGIGDMHLEVYTSDRTERFHAEVYRVAGINGEPTEGTQYNLNTRHMVRIALEWSDALSDAQRVQLLPLATGQQEPTAEQARAIVGPGGTPGGGGSTPSGSGSGSGSGKVTDVERLAQEVSRNVREPLEIQRLEQLREHETSARILAEHAGYATLNGRCYRLTREGEATRINEVTLTYIRGQVAAPFRPSPIETEAPSGAPRPVLLQPGLQGREGGHQLEPPQPLRIAAGDIVIVNQQQTFEARDAKTGQPLLGTFEGGQWYRVVGPDGRNRAIEPLTTEGIRPVEIGGQTVLAEPFEPEPTAQPATGGARLAAGGVALAGGAIMVLNEILAPIGGALQGQRETIRAGGAEIDLWVSLGANPKTGIWDRWAQAPAPEGTKPDTAVFGTYYFPYVADIDADRLRAQLPLRIRTLHDLEVLLHSAQGLGALQQANDRWYAVVNRWDRTNPKKYDITESIATVRASTVDVADASLRNRLAARPENERRGNLLHVPRGTALYRSQGGVFTRQPLIGAGARLGGHALVREIRRTNNLILSDYVMVEPVNGDAYQAVAFTEYHINRNIEDVWQEVKDGGRKVTPPALPRGLDDPLVAFQAGPETSGERRFGETQYTRDPAIPGKWTVARGEVLAFWVSASALERVDDAEAAPR